MNMNMRAFEQDRETDMYEDDSPIDWSGFPMEDPVKYSGLRLHLSEEYHDPYAADGRIGFRVDSIALEDDPE